MSPNKNRKVIFATCYGKIDKPRQVPSTELYHKTSNPLVLFFPLKFQKNFPPSWFTSLYKGEGGCMNTIISLAYMKQSHVLFLEPLKSNFSNPEVTQEPYQPSIKTSIFQKQSIAKSWKIFHKTLYVRCLTILNTHMNSATPCF